MFSGLFSNSADTVKQLDMCLAEVDVPKVTYEPSVKLTAEVHALLFLDEQRDSWGLGKTTVIVTSM